MQETYTLGYERAAMAFVERRRLDLNGAFFLPYVGNGMRVPAARPGRRIAWS